MVCTPEYNSWKSFSDNVDSPDKVRGGRSFLESCRKLADDSKELFSEYLRLSSESAAVGARPGRRGLKGGLLAEI
jgi:hypothetical protein